MNEASLIAPISVRALGDPDKQRWLELWQAYLGFYDARVPVEVTEHTWEKILRAERVLGLGAERNGELVGFAIIVLHDATWSRRLTAYLEDLFVSPDTRGIGVGRAIIDHLMEVARTKGWGSLYWHTHQENLPARKLYDLYAMADDFVRYRIRIYPD